MGDAVNAKGGTLQSTALCEARQDRVRKSQLSGLLGGHEAVMLLVYGNELIETRSRHVNIFLLMELY